MKENPEDIYPKYANRVEEYIQLICRGATSQMCEEFNLEFTDERGIIAWATPELFKVFSGPGMVEGDEWRIHLGRQIELTCSDPDGFMFISGLLEDAMFYPLFPQSISAPKFQWETVKDRNGIWVTRPKVAFDDGQVEDDDVEMDEFEVGDAGNESEDELPDALANEYSSTYSSCGSPDLGLDESDIDPPPHVIPNARIPDHTYNCSEDDELDELENSGEDELDSEDDELYSGDEEVQAGLVDGHRSTREISSTTSQGPPWNQRWRAG